MTPDQLQSYRNLLTLGIIPANDTTLEYPFRQGWNEGVRFAQKQLDKIVGTETVEQK